MKPTHRIDRRVDFNMIELNHRPPPAPPTPTAIDCVNHSFILAIDIVE